MSNNESAFPKHIFEKVGDISKGVASGGITKREYFVAKAMAGLISAMSPDSFAKATRIASEQKGCLADEYVAVMAVNLADATLRAMEE